MHIEISGIAKLRGAAEALGNANGQFTVEFAECLPIVFLVDGREYSWERSRSFSAISESTVLQVEYVSVDVMWSLRSGQSQVTYKTARWGTPNAN